MPAADEVAAVYSANERNLPCPRLTVFTAEQNRGLRNVNFYDASCDPLTFPLLLSLGELGWEMRMPYQRGNRNVTLCEYYAYSMAYRQDFGVIHRSDKLAEQYAVTAYVKKLL